MHQHANGGYLWGWWLWVIVIFYFMLYVFLVVCNEHVLLIKVKKQCIIKNDKKRPNWIRRKKVGEMESFIEDRLNQCYLRHALHVCVKSHTLHVCVKCISSQNHRRKCAARMLLWVILVPTYLGTKEFTWVVFLAMFGNSQINFDYLCDLLSQGKMYFPYSLVNVYLRVFRRKS